MSRSVSLGVVGCGAIAQLVHLRLIPSVPGARLAALADPDRQHLARGLARAPGAIGFDSAEELLARGAVDAIVVCSPTHLHADVALRALAAGVHVYLEKPIAATLDDAKRVAEAWRSSGLVGMVGFNCRFNPIYGRLRALLEQDRAGTTVCMRTTFTTAPRELPEWKRNRATGGGVLLDLASHHIDLARFLFGRDVASVRATITSRRSDEDTALLELELAGGIGVQSFFSLAAAERELVEVYGERALLSASRFTSLDVEVRDNPNGLGGTLSRLARRAVALRHVPGALQARRAPLREPGYAAALRRFVDVVRSALGGAPARCTPDFDDGLACLEVIDAAERSARSSAAVTLAH
jgi:myo-inositol 2-dehydrogenase / D-chiro-inositol 1-dehydrogenase